MREITKGAEPRSLTEHRNSPHSNYGNYADKDKLRESLVRDQRGLCCYCMLPLVAAEISMKIEHWQCQEDHPGRQLDYSNMLGACLGGKGLPEKEQHCDTRKGKKSIKFNPADPAHHIEQRCRYDINGTITSDDAEFKKHLSDVLGLNITSLKNRRKAVMDALAQWLREYRVRHHRNPDVAILQRMRSQRLPPTGNLEPLAQVAVWWLDQRLARSAT